MIFATSNLLVALFLALGSLGANAVPLTSWFPALQASFSNTSFPLKRCFKRRNVAPGDLQECGPMPKTCFFGDQTCDGEQPYPTERCVCDGSPEANGRWACEPEPCPPCMNAVVTQALWVDNENFGCAGYVGFCNSTFCPNCNTYENFGLTPTEVCCVCGGGELSEAGTCNDLNATLPEPRQWVDSVGSSCSFYEEDPQTRCIEFANEFNSEFGLTVGQACCACQGIEEPPTGDKCTDLQGWNTALNRSNLIVESSPQGSRTCEQLTRADCVTNTENFGITASEACCKCGGGSRNPNLPTDFDPTTTTLFTAGSCASDSSRFNMCIKLSPNFPPQDVALVDAAAARWGSVIVADSPDFVYDFDVVSNRSTGFVAGAADLQLPKDNSSLAAFYTFLCGFDPEFPLNSTDDINVCGNLNSLSSQNTIAQAATVFGDKFARFSTFEVNADAVWSTRTGDFPGRLYDVVLHELAHVLGQSFEIRVDGRVVLNITSCQYFGENANRVYSEVSGCPNDENNTLPLAFAFDFDPDTSTFFLVCNGHISEFCFGSELMTPFFNNVTDAPLSTLTVAMMEDLGYTVDYSQADNFTKADINPDCLCNATTTNNTTQGGEADDGGRRRLQKSMIKEMSKSAGADRIDADTMLEIVLGAKEDLERMNDAAKAFMEESKDDTHIAIPGMMVLYRDDENNVGSIYVTLDDK